MKIFRKICKYLAVVIAVILAADVIAVLFFSVYRPPVQKASAIVVLGSAINTPDLYNRSLQGLKLYQEGKANVIVLSGGQDFAGAETEAAYMQKVITANATEPVPVIIEDQSHSTYDNLTNTKAKIGGGKSLIIVSDSFHLARAVLLAARLGFYPLYWSSPDPIYYSKKELALYYLREMAAIIDYIPKFIKG